MSEFLKSADSRQTSDEIMVAIYQLAEDHEREAERIWEAPTRSEVLNIIAAVTADGADPADYTWGAAGSNWCLDARTGAVLS